MRLIRFYPGLCRTGIRELVRAQIRARNHDTCDKSRNTLVRDLFFMGETI